MSRTLVLTVLQLHLPLGQAGRGLELAVVPGEGGHEAGVVGGAHSPLLLALGQVGPGQQQHVGQSPAHQHLGLGGTAITAKECFGWEESGNGLGGKGG